MSKILVHNKKKIKKDLIIKANHVVQSTRTQSVQKNNNPNDYNERNWADKILTLGCPN